MTFDWDGLGTLVPVVLWLLFLVLRKVRPQAVPQQQPDMDEADEPAPSEASVASYEPAPATVRRSRRRRHDETDGFERDYDPIEPSW